jgi:FMN phosphatase YigB (HAD superfamily)
MLKKTILTLCLVTQALLCNLESNSTQKYIIATDIDNVLLQSDTHQRMQAILNPLNTFSIATYLWSCRTYYKSDEPFSRTCREALYIKEVMRNAGTENRAAYFVRMMARKKYRLTDTIEVYSKLCAQGVRIHTATNIGSLFFQDLKIDFPDIFNEQFVQDGLTVDYAATDIIAKPDIRYFNMLQEKINPLADHIIIFVDDKLENVEAANKAGLIGIHFKNAQQLKEELDKIIKI